MSEENKPVEETQPAAPVDAGSEQKPTEGEGSSQPQADTEAAK